MAITAGVDASNGDDKVQDERPELDAPMEQVPLFFVPFARSPVAHVDLNDTFWRTRLRRHSQKGLALMVREERFHFLTEFGVADACVIERCLPFGRGQRLNSKENLFDTSVLGGVHLVLILRKLFQSASIWYTSKP